MQDMQGILTHRLRTTVLACKVSFFLISYDPMIHLGSHVPEGKEICSHVVLVFFTFTSRPKEFFKIMPKAILPGFSIVLNLLLTGLFLEPTVLKESDFRI